MKTKFNIHILKYGHLILAGIIFSVSLISYLAYAIVVKSGNGYRINVGDLSKSVIGYGGDCTVVTNSSSSTKDIFIPTKTTASRNAFKANKPSYITINDADDTPQCGTTTSRNCLVGKVYSNANICYCQSENSVGEKIDEWKCSNECGGNILTCPGSTDGQQCNCGGCFVEGTKVTLADGVLVPIESIKVGDALMGAGGKTNIVKYLSKHFYQRNLYSLNGSDFFVSDTHPFMTTQGWKSFYPKGSQEEGFSEPISELGIGDVLVTDHGLVRINSVASNLDPQYVYNFTVSGDHTYYADGYLVHNIKVEPAI